MSLKNYSGVIDERMTRFNIYLIRVSEEENKEDGWQARLKIYILYRIDKSLFISWINETTRWKGKKKNNLLPNT